MTGFPRRVEQRGVIRRGVPGLTRGIQGHYRCRMAEDDLRFFPPHAWVAGV